MMFAVRTACVWLTVWILAIYLPVNTHSQEQPYDYIIDECGGSAGLVLANRLSEDKNNEVLVIEAGDDTASNPTFAVPLLSISGNIGDTVWNFTTVPQENSLFGFPNQTERTCAAKLLGGGSMLNGMVYSRGNFRDYDEWNANGATGWSYADVLPYFLKSEDVQIEELEQSVYHSDGGLLGVSRPPLQKLAKHIFRAAEELGVPVGDCNEPDLLGVCSLQTTIDRGRRASTYHAFLKPARRRSNLHIKTNAMVTKVLIENNITVGVEYIQRSQKHTAVVNREVIVSAGAINSPKLLMLSGIGPRDHLESLGIDVKVDLPVGQNLTDHVLIRAFTCIRRPGLTITSKDFASPKNFLKYITAKTGPLTSPFGADVMMKMVVDPAQAGQQAPDIHYIFNSLTFPFPGLLARAGTLTDTLVESLDCPTKNSFTTSVELLRPKSRGTVSLQSAHYEDQPLIDPNYFADPDDMATLIKGMRYLNNVIVDTEAMQSIGTEKIKPVSKCSSHSYDSDDYWDCFIRHTAGSAWHVASTCKMGAVDDTSAVVDPQLRVKGIDGLRVVDASIMPTIISGNTNAPVIMIAEKAADMIQGKSPLGR
ncbi:hypothetical protein ScPMuIL_005388 [Solemya velum]